MGVNNEIYPENYRFVFKTTHEIADIKMSKGPSPLLYWECAEASKAILAIISCDTDCRFLYLQVSLGQYFDLFLNNLISKFDHNYS